jgi:hypothetical protein
MAWLLNLLVKPVLDWVLGQLRALYTLWKKDRADHAKAVDQAAQDNEKAGHINEESKSDEVDQAIEDSLKHL